MNTSVDFNTDIENQMDKIELAYRKRLKRYRQKNRNLKIALSVFSCILLMVITITTISLIDFDKGATVIEAQVPGGEFIIETAFHCANCSEDPNQSHCEFCTPKEVIMEV